MNGCRVICAAVLSWHGYANLHAVGVFSTFKHLMELLLRHDGLGDAAWNQRGSWQRAVLQSDSGTPDKTHWANKIITQTGIAFPNLSLSLHCQISIIKSSSTLLLQISLSELPEIKNVVTNEFSFFIVTCRVRGT
jgi:hypothetical protein